MTRWVHFRRVAVQVWDRTIGRVLSWVLIALIRGYQLTISPLTGPTCRYHPTCSAYALRAVRGHGPIKGALLAGWRLLRCNPWSAGGIDFPPERGHWRGRHEIQDSQPTAAGKASVSAQTGPGQG